MRNIGIILIAVALVAQTPVPSPFPIGGSSSGGTCATLGGDLSGTCTSATVAKVNGSTPGGTCTNQFTRSLSSSAVPTCASVVNADITNSTIDLTAKVTGLLPTANMAAAANIRICEVAIGDPGSASPVLADDNDTPQVCSNDFGATLTITAVHCYAASGSPTVTPIISAGSATSILSGALTCDQTAGGAAGTLNGTPTQTSGQTLDLNITTAGGTAKYIVMRITRTL